MRNSSLYQEILESNDNIAYNNMAFYDEYIRLLNELILFSHSSLEIDINFQLDLNSNSIFSIGNLEYLNDGLKIKACLQNFIAKMTSDAYICGRYLQQAWSLFSTCMLLSSIESRCTQAALLTEVCLQLGCINFITNGNIMNCKRKFNGSLCSN